MRLPWGRARHRQRWAPRLHLRRACHAKLKGTGGRVVDGGVRDLEEMIEHALPALALRLTHSPAFAPRRHRHQRLALVPGLRLAVASARMLSQGRSASPEG